jgi:hypothetical protein
MEEPMVYITEVHMTGGGAHVHIASVRWRDPADNGTGESTRTEMVEWIKNKNGDARVRTGGLEVPVGVVDADPPYIRTYADGVWADNLLELSRY